MIERQAIDAKIRKKDLIMAEEVEMGNEMWGGRFSGGVDELMERINRSIDIDKRLYKEDIAVSMAHVSMLVRVGLLKREEGVQLEEGLTRVLGEIESGKFGFHDHLEDIHMNVEHRLRELIGPLAGKLHTGRSRNDQVVTDVRLWLRGEIDGLEILLEGLQRVLLLRSREHAGTLMPGYTHLQVAQPVTFGHHLMAYVEMLGRDRERLRDCRVRVNESPLGSGALSGTSFPIDREHTSEILGFGCVMRNSMDGVSSRDFVLEFLSVGLNMSLHLSRLAEELVLWTTEGFGFVKLSEGMTTGSSMMPQKRNPDAAELVRAKPGQLLGCLSSLSVVMKGLPLTYAKDMQEDKKSLFDAVDTLTLSILVMGEMVRGLEVDKVSMRKALDKGYPTATDLADWLVQELDIPFREAHRITGRIVSEAERLGLQLSEMPLELMRETDGRIGEGVYEVLLPERSLDRRTSFGGSSPACVLRAIEEAERRFLRDRGGEEK